MGAKCDVCDGPVITCRSCSGPLCWCDLHVHVGHELDALAFI